MEEEQIRETEATAGGETVASVECGQIEDERQASAESAQETSDSVAAQGTAEPIDGNLPNETPSAADVRETNERQGKRGKKSASGKASFGLYYKAVAAKYGFVSLLSMALFAAGMFLLAEIAGLYGIGKPSGLRDWITLGVAGVSVAAIVIGSLVYVGSRRMRFIDALLPVGFVGAAVIAVCKAAAHSLTMKSGIVCGSAAAAAIVLSAVRICRFRAEIKNIGFDPDVPQSKQYLKLLHKGVHLGLVVCFVAATAACMTFLDRLGAFRLLMDNFRDPANAVIVGVMLAAALLLCAGLIVRVSLHKVSVCDLQMITLLSASLTIVLLTCFGVFDVKMLIAGMVLLLVGALGLIMCVFCISLPKNTEVYELNEEIEEADCAAAQVAADAVGTEEDAPAAAEEERAVPDEPHTAAEAVAEDADETEQTTAETEEAVTTDLDEPIAEPVPADEQERIETLEARVDALFARNNEAARTYDADLNERIAAIERRVEDIYELLLGLAAGGAIVAAGAPQAAESPEDVPAGVTDGETAETFAEELIEAPDDVPETDEEDDLNAQFARWLGDEAHIDTWIDAVDSRLNVKAKLDFEIKMRAADEQVKQFYSEIKNELLSYGMNCRVSKMKENYNKGRNQIARITINGKTLMVYLAIDPKTLDPRVYHHIDVSDKKGVADLPTLIKVKSKIAVRKIKALLETITEDLVIKKKKGYEPQDFAKDFSADGYSSVWLKGYGYMVKDGVTREEADNYPDSFARSLIETVETTDIPHRFIKTELTLAQIAAHFVDGETVDIEAVRARGLSVPNANYLVIKPSERLDAKYKIYAHEYDPDAVKMICIAGGEAFIVQYLRPEGHAEDK